MKKILLAIGERALYATHGKLLHFVDSIISAGYAAEVFTYHDDVSAKAEDLYREDSRVTVKLVKPTNFLIDYRFRGDLVKGFVKMTRDIIIPGTDMHFYKVTAFDDFYGHMESFAYQDFDLSDCSLVLMPIPSHEEPISAEGDIFYSDICYLAREKGIPICGLQVYPAVHTAPVFVRTMDYIIVKAAWEGDFLAGFGIAPERICLLEDKKESYLMQTVEDHYTELLFNSGVDILKDEICIMVINHPKFRAFIKDVLKIIGEMDLPKLVMFMKRNYSVKEMSEDEIIQDVYIDTLQKMKGRVFSVDPDTMSRQLMLADVIISATYLTPLQFAASKGKLSIVYNPLYDNVPNDENVVFMDSPAELVKAVSERYKTKMRRTTIESILEKCLSEKKSV